MAAAEAGLDPIASTIKENTVGKRGRHPEDLSGQDIGKLHVERMEETPKGPMFICTCQCGGTTRVSGSALRRAKEPTRSCGCLRRSGGPGREKDMDVRRWVVQLRRQGLSFAGIGKEIGLTRQRAQQLYATAEVEG